MAKQDEKKYMNLFYALRHKLKNDN